MSTMNPVVARSAAASLRTRLWLMLGALVMAAGIAPLQPATAQDAGAAAILPAPELEELVGPIALYPDDLIAIVLPASTYPLQVVEAARFLDARADDPKLEPDADWDDSVVALLNYPEVVRLLNDDLDWTWELGTAVLNQRADVLDAVQGFRDRAYAAGNLKSDEHQVVTEDQGTIAITPADPKVIYVPYYEPRRVVVYQTIPAYQYYPWGYPVYYYPYPAGYAFQTGFFWGVTSAFFIGWHTHDLHVNHYGYAGHPYYGWSYYNPYYVRNNVYVNVNAAHGGAWQPHYGHGGRPVVRGQEGRVTDGGGSRPNVARTAPSNNARVGGGMSQALEANRTRPQSPQAQPTQSSRVTPSQRALNPRLAAAPTASPAETYRSTRVYRSAPSPAAAPTDSAPARRYGGGMSRAARDSSGTPVSSAPPAAAPNTAAPSPSRMAATSGSGNSGSYRGNSSGHSQSRQPTHGGQSRSVQR